MRLGAQPAVLEPDSKAAQCYGATEISERHRHRYEFNNVYRQQFAAHGMRSVGTSPDGKLVEIVEMPEHPWFVAVQFHPGVQVAADAAAPAVRGLYRRGGRAARRPGGTRSAIRAEPAAAGAIVPCKRRTRPRVAPPLIATANCAV